MNVCVLIGVSAGLLRCDTSVQNVREYQKRKGFRKGGPDILWGVDAGQNDDMVKDWQPVMEADHRMMGFSDKDIRMKTVEF